ncbi:hypothetical protein [Robertkochia sediminum]|uniref:hypothetical protein n=1 Tax=Robertkochia sediminum TaxID=2785326 RepID=UPI001931B6B2|nr:hypothetical protein [Robertkochia sediminum]MBL7471472.1 hypothetical protein [Robertkochia sediminum]
MATRKSLSLFFLVFLLIALILFLFVEYKKKQFISELNYLEFPGFTLSTNHSEIDLLNRSISIQQAQINTYTATDSILVTIPEIRVQGIHYSDYIFNNTVRLDSLIIDSPLLYITRYDTLPLPPVNETDSNKPFIQIKHIFLNNGKILRQDTSKDTLMSLPSLRIAITDLSTDPENNAPPKIGAYRLTILNTIIKPNTLSRVTLARMELTKEKWTLEHLLLRPTHDKYNYSKFIPYQDDWISGTINNLELHQPDITQLSDSVFKADHIAINGLQLDIFRDKHIARKNTQKPMLTTLLNDIPLKIALDSVLINNGKLTYGERMPENNNYGSVTLNNIQNNIYRLNTIEKDTVFINFSANSGSQGLVKGSCTLPLASESAHFDMHLYMHKVNFATFNSFTETNMNMTNKGIINNAYINASGDHISAKGRSYLNYDEFEVTLVNKKTGGAKKILSSIANFIVPKKRDLNEEEKFTITRNQERSFFNYMWLCAQKGITVNMI